MAKKPLTAEEGFDGNNKPFINLGMNPIPDDNDAVSHIYWENSTPGLPYKNDVEYTAGRIVLSDNILYQCLSTTIGNAPPNATFWGMQINMDGPDPDLITRNKTSLVNAINEVAANSGINGTVKVRSFNLIGVTSNPAIAPVGTEGEAPWLRWPYSKGECYIVLDSGNGFGGGFWSTFPAGTIVEYNADASSTNELGGQSIWFTRIGNAKKGDKFLVGALKPITAVTTNATYNGTLSATPFYGQFDLYDVVVWDGTNVVVDNSWRTDPEDDIISNPTPIGTTFELCDSKSHYFGTKVRWLDQYSRYEIIPPSGSQIEVLSMNYIGAFTASFVSSTFVPFSTCAFVLPGGTGEFTGKDGYLMTWDGANWTEKFLMTSYLPIFETNPIQMFNSLTSKLYSFDPDIGRWSDNYIYINTPGLHNQEYESTVPFSNSYRSNYKMKVVDFYSLGNINYDFGAEYTIEATYGKFGLWYQWVKTGGTLSSLVRPNGNNTNNTNQYLTGLNVISSTGGGDADDNELFSQGTQTAQISKLAVNIDDLTIKINSQNKLYANIGDLIRGANLVSAVTTAPPNIGWNGVGDPLKANYTFVVGDSGNGFGTSSAYGDWSAFPKYTVVVGAEGNNSTWYSLGLAADGDLFFTVANDSPAPLVAGLGIAAGSYKHKYTWRTIDVPEGILFTGFNTHQAPVHGTKVLLQSNQTDKKNAYVVYSYIGGNVNRWEAIESTYDDHYSTYNSGLVTTNLAGKQQIAVKVDNDTIIINANNELEFDINAIPATPPEFVPSTPPYGINTDGAGTSNINLMSFDKTLYRSAAYTVQISYDNTTIYEISKILVLHDGVDAYYAQTATAGVGTSLVTFDAFIDGDDVWLTWSNGSVADVTIQINRDNLFPL